MKIRYCRRTGQVAAVRDYDVRVQGKPRGRWVTAGMVSGFGSGGTWAALGASANAWTAYRTTRSEAVRDMLAGRTYLSTERDAR